MEDLIIVKIGGNVIDEEDKLSSFLHLFGALPGKKILVHGGGKLATSLAGRLGIQQQLIEGRRITDAETLKIVTMVYAGYINKRIVAELQSLGFDALGLCGADAKIISAHKRIHPSIDYGFVGDVDGVNSQRLSEFLQAGLLPVIAPISSDKEGQLLNTNADTIAQEIAKAMSPSHAVQLVYTFEKSGVLLDASDDSTIIPSISPSQYQKLKAEQKIFAGMIPKIDNAFAALQHGVKKVLIGKAEKIAALLSGESGTEILAEAPKA